MKEFKTKPVTIKAFRMTADVYLVRSKIPSEILENKATPFVFGGTDENKLHSIETLEGVMRVNVGDWVIEGLAGELYPCSHDIFVRKYAAVEASYK